MPRKIDLWEIEKKARKALGVGLDDQVDHDELRAAFKKCIPPEDIEKLLDRRGDVLFERRFQTKPLKDAPLLACMGEKVQVDLDQLIRGPDNKVCRLRGAPPAFIRERSDRSKKKKEEATLISDLEEWEADGIEAWAKKERKKGRPEEQLVYENFIEETGLLIGPGEALPKTA